MASTSGGQNSHGHGGRRNKSDRKKVFNPGSGMKQERGKSRRRIRLEENIYESCRLQGKLEATYSSTNNSEFAVNLLSLENRRR